MSALNKTVKEVFLLKPQHDTCFPDKPTVNYPTIRGMKHTPTSIPPRAGSPISCQCCWPKHLTQAGPRDCPLSKLTQQKQQVRVHVCGGGTEPGQFPVWLTVVSGHAPAAGGSEGGRDSSDHCQKLLCKQGPNDLLGITLPAGQPF